MRKVAGLVVVAGVVLGAAAGLGARGAEAGVGGEPVFHNPIVKQRADSQVYLHTDGYYYFTGTVPEYDRLELRRAKTIQGLGDPAAGDIKTVWKKHETGPMGSHIWAPEIHYIDGKWFMYFAAGDAKNVWNIKIYAIENDSANPLEGDWKEMGQVKTNWNDDKQFALDATTFEHKGQWYFVWAERDPAIRTNSNLYIAKMDSPTSIEGKGVMISKPEYPWECVKYKVNEGPAVLEKNGRVFMTYSASATDFNYCMGMLTADGDADLLDPRSWKKSAEPVMKSDAAVKVFGPGHNSFTTTPDGKWDILVYHARNYAEIVGDPLKDPNRNTRAQVIHWTAEGAPVFMPPAGD
ncbi:MAG TPA: glycoside hydrolase family 43 protein [Phycisphaerae bacterium]|nr:glycoside hydrolase family 43 protein [Phycisphaerae bacterium]